MTHKPAAAVRPLGASRTYTDGAEERVLEALKSASDRSDGSDELHRLSVDWPTTYHFSPKRSNILRPFAFGPEHRILEVGAGTGVLTRHLGERGSTIIALEGDPTRARAAAMRCFDLDNVEVVCGLLEELEDPLGFDLVIVIGVLEYAGGVETGRHPHLDFLRHAAGLTREDGALLLAIENQIGLKYMLGFSEDHLAEPWSGISGYPGNPGVRTFPKAELGALIDDAGMSAQRWYYPFPDYKLPGAILAEAAYQVADATDFVDQLVGMPVRDLASPPTLFCDSRAAHRVFLDAGLGPEVANSFLVLAGRDPGGLSRWVDDAAVAWHFSSERRRRWRRFHVVSQDGDALQLVSSAIRDSDSTGPADWLRHQPSKEQTYLRGRTLEQEAINACNRHDLNELQAILAGWHRTLLGHERVTSSEPEANYPYAPASVGRELPPEFFDVSLSNFVDTSDGSAFVDREWRVGTGVDPMMVQFRALWYFALDLVVSGTGSPFEPTTTVNDLALRFAELTGIVVDDDTVERLLPAEAEVRAAVTGADSATVEQDLRRLGATSQCDAATASTLPVSRVRRDLVRLGEALDEHRRRIANLEEAVGDRDRHTEALSGELDRVSKWARELESELGRAQRWATELNEFANQKLIVEDELRRSLAEVTDRAEGQRVERDALAGELTRTERRAQKLGRELDQYRAWEAKWLRKPLVRVALAFHRLFDSGNGTH